MPSPKRGFLVTFEGTEGAGKSTLIRMLARRLTRELGIRPVVTREPGGSRVAERIRKVILDNPMDPWTELFLYEAARAEHLAEVIRPALEQGKLVLCDRFTDSTIAYQGHARGLPLRQIQVLNQIATQGIQPGLTVWVDVSPEVGLKRATDANRFEVEGVRFQTKVRTGFLKSMKAEPRRWFRVDSQENSPEELVELVFWNLRARLKRKIRG